MVPRYSSGTLSTIHSAKGLKWESVFVLHAADGNIPSDLGACRCN